MPETKIVVSNEVPKPIEKRCSCNGKRFTLSSVTHILLTCSCLTGTPRLVELSKRFQA